MMQLKTAFLGIWGTGTSLGSVVVANYVAGWLQVAALAVGIVSGITATIWLDRLNRAKVRQINYALCDQCRDGHIPRVCPLSPRDRPKDCPLDRPLLKL